MKIIHGPLDTAGLAISSAIYEKRIGLDSSALLFAKKKMGSMNKEEYSNVKYYLDSSSFLNNLKIIPYQLTSIRKKILEHDIISLTDGGSFLLPPYFNFLFSDLSFLKNRGKKLVVTYQGCEIRLAQQCKLQEINACKNCMIPNKYWYDPRNWNWMKEKKIENYDKYCDLIFYHNPDLKNFIPRGEFRPYMKVDYRDWVPKKSNRPKKKIIIGHAPKNRLVKGTEYIIDTINQLLKKRNDFEFVLFENMPYSEVIKKYHKVDLFIDQMLIGWYGGVSVELMALEKPVICYIRESDLKNIPNNFANDLPIINANSNTLEEKIEFFLDNPEQIRIQGKISRDFVIEYHDPIKIAKWLKLKYESIM